ncbi:MAG: ABC transporter ATP-binding protein [Fibrobacterota bacterium]
MDTYKNIFKFLRPYLWQMAAGIILIFIYTIFSSVNIAMVKPIFDGVIKHGKKELIQKNRDLKADTVNPYSLFYRDLKKTAKNTGSFLTLKMSKKEYISRIKKYGSNIYRHSTIIEFLMIFSAAYILAVFIKTLTQYIQKLIFANISIKIITDVRSELYAKILSLEMPFFAEYKTGTLINRLVSEVSSIRNLLLTNLIDLIRNSFQVITFFVILMVIDLKLTLFILIAMPLLMLTLGRLAQTLKRYSVKMQNINSRVMGFLAESFSGIRVILAFNRHSYELERFKKILLSQKKLFLKNSKVSLLSGPISEFFNMSIGIGMLFFALSTRVLNPDSPMTMGDFVMYLAFLFSMMKPLKSLNNTFLNFQKGSVIAQRVYNLLNRETTIKESPNAFNIDGVKTSIAFENVSFSYTKKKEQVLKNISFEVKKGEIIALVGASGGGKSTIINLVPRLYDPNEGRVLLDGRDIREISLNSLRNNIGIVTQESILFNDTAKANIAYGDPSPDMDRVEEAARAAHAHEFISKLPEGYETVIGERGNTLSGGQRQRLTIARALYKSPDLLIFDEATSSLDTESERLVQDAIDRLIHNCTTIIVAHRLSTIRQADKIVVVDNGRIIEEGTHDELMNMDKYYKKIYDLQFREE